MSLTINAFCQTDQLYYSLSHQGKQAQVNTNKPSRKANILISQTLLKFKWLHTLPFLFYRSWQMFTESVLLQDTVLILYYCWKIQYSDFPILIYQPFQITPCYCLVHRLSSPINTVNLYLWLDVLKFCLSIRSSQFFYIYYNLQYLTSFFLYLADCSTFKVQW